MDTTDRPILCRKMTTLEVWALGVGIVVCGQYFGWNLGLAGNGPVAMLAASLLVCLLFLAWVLTLAELSVAMPRADGPLEYGRRACGPGLGFVMAWSMLLECQFGAIATALATGSYVAFLLNPADPEPAVQFWSSLATVVVFFLLQAWGVKEQARIQVLMTGLALAGLVVYWFVAGSNFSWERAWPTSEAADGKGTGAVLAAVPYALWWLIIIEGVALAAEETNDPPRTIPRGLVLAMLTVIFMVLLTLGLGCGAVDWGELTGDYPLALVVRQVLDGRAPLLLYGFGLIALFGLIASYHGLCYSTSRQAFSLGRAGYLPTVLGGLHATRRTPVPALLASSLITVLFVVASQWFPKAINVTVLVAGLASLIWYVLAMGCLLVLRRREPHLFSHYRAPLGRMLPVAVLLLSVLFIWVYREIDVNVVPLTALLYAIGFAVYRLGGGSPGKGEGDTVPAENAAVSITRAADTERTHPGIPFASSLFYRGLGGMTVVVLGVVLLLVARMLLTREGLLIGPTAEAGTEMCLLLVLTSVALLLVCLITFFRSGREPSQKSG